MTEPTVRLCAAPGCQRYTVHALCALHRAPPEPAPEHQPSPDRAAWAVLVASAPHIRRNTSMGRLKTLKPRLQPMMRRGPSTMTTATIRTRGNTWMAIRERILKRDCGLCQPSLRAGLVVVATEVDHIVPLQRGGTDDDHNLQAISGDVHKAKTAAELHGATWDERAWFAGR